MATMLERIEHPELPVRDVTVPTTLVVRRSCAERIWQSILYGVSDEEIT